MSGIEYTVITKVVYKTTVYAHTEQQAKDQAHALGLADHEPQGCEVTAYPTR